MLIEVRRYEKSANGLATVGRVYIDGAYESFSLEPGDPLPAGNFRLVMAPHSPRFGRPMPLVEDPAHPGRELHPGNTSSDSTGCTLPGFVHPDRADFVGSSVAAWQDILSKIEPALGLTRVPGPAEDEPPDRGPYRWETSVWSYEFGSPQEPVTITYSDIPVDPAQAQTSGG